MAAPQNFRTAFHGFNREDVVRYIDYLTAKHNAQINELNNEIDFLRNKTESHGLDMVTPERMFEAEVQRDEYKEQLDAQDILIRELEAKCAALEQGTPMIADSAESAAQIARLEEKCADLEAQLVQAQIAPQAEINPHELAAMDQSLWEALEEKQKAEEALAELESRCAVLEKQLSDALSANPQAADTLVSQTSIVSELEARCAALEKQLSDALAANAQAADTQFSHASAVSALESRCAALEKELANALAAKTQTESAWNAHAINAAQTERRCAALEKELANAIAAKQKAENDIASRNTRALELEGRCTILKKELADAVAAKQQAESGIASRDIRTLELENRCAALEKELTDAIAAKQLAEQERETSRKCHIEQELEAYRRAERAERVAQERADKIYYKANGVLADATVKVDEATAQISGLADQVMEQLRQLQSAVIGSKQALTDAAATMYNLRPETEDK